MAKPSPAPKKAAAARRRRPVRPSARRGGAATRRRWKRTLRASPGWLRGLLIVVLVIAAGLTVNGLYQILRKPTELLTPMSGSLNKTPPQTWRSYGRAFTENSTRIIRPSLLAALAQMEGSGNPVAHTYWRFNWSVHPFEIYRPASTSVGMYQLTDGTFEQARHYCIRDHEVRTTGGLTDLRGCWFNSLYFRVLPSDSIELTSAYLDTQVQTILARQHRLGATLAQSDQLAAMVHLCGAGTAETYARRDFRLTRGQRCGDHDPAGYLMRVRHLEEVFARLEAAAES